MMIDNGDEERSYNSDPPRGLQATANCEEANGLMMIAVTYVTAYCDESRVCDKRNAYDNGFYCVSAK